MELDQKPSPETLLPWLHAKFCDWAELEVDAVDPTENITQYGLDSLGALTFLNEIEDVLEIEILASMLWDNPTLEALSKTLAEEMRRQG